MNKRVHEIAKERGLPAKDVLEKLRAAGVNVKAASSSVDEAVALEALGNGDTRSATAAAPVRETRGGGDGAAAAGSAAPAASTPRPDSAASTARPDSAGSTAPDSAGSTAAPTSPRAGPAAPPASMPRTSARPATRCRESVPRAPRVAAGAW